MTKNKLFIFLILIILFLYPVPYTLHPVLAHEAYVLPRAHFEAGLQSPGINTLVALQNPSNLLIFIEVSLGVLSLLILNFLFNQSRWGRGLDKRLNKFSRFGPFIVRLTISASLFFSALSGSFLGPELPLSFLPYPEMIKVILFIVSGMFLVGFLTELAAAVTLLIYIVAVLNFGIYSFTYLNYLGELIVLFLFGLRFYSIDQKIFGNLKRLKKLEPFETTIVRIFYGSALLFAAIAVKILHSQISLEVINTYNLTQFHWLFPSDPLLLTLGAALAEITIGLFIILGFSLRLTVLISLFYITLSLIFFREAVWPHLLLYGISINLLITKQNLSIDEFLKTKNWLKEKLVFP